MNKNLLIKLKPCLNKFEINYGGKIFCIPCVFLGNSTAKAA